jgi:tetratricopeptide (TPR) repeat protein
MGSAFALQEAISRAIIGALQVRLSPRLDEQLNTQPEIEPEAYDLYLKGRYYYARLSMGGFDQSIEAFRKAIAIDPDYAAPHAGLANAYSLAGFFGVMPPREAFPLSVAEAEVALALDPGSSEALVARGMAWLVHERNWDRARSDLELALHLSPNSSLAHWAYTLYLMVLDPGAAVGSALRALSLDPLSLPIMNLVAFAYLEQGMIAEAQQMDEEMTSLDPGFAPAYWNRGVIHMSRGQFDEALESLGRSVELSGGMPSTLAVQAHVSAKSGDASSALAVLAELLERREIPQRGYVSPVLIAYVYEGLGRTDDALDWLETALVERDGWLVQLNSFPRFESLRDDRRFRDIQRRVGLPEGQGRQTGGER